MNFKARAAKILSMCVLAIIVGIVSGAVIRWFPLLSDGAVFLLALAFIACCIVVGGGLISLLHLFFVWLHHRVKNRTSL